jgi:glycosyltransferase involved in cell wall biosynthesis
MPQISVVVPVYNEAPNAEALVAELRATLDRLTLTSEVVLVDDGSTDETFALLATACAADPRFRIVRLRRNFGQTAALAAGLDHCGGAIVVTMDGDLQNDPADIPRLVAALDAGADVVNGWRRDRKDPFLSRQVPSIVANAIIGATTNVRIHDYGCGIKAFRSEIAKSLKLYGEMHRFIAAIAGDLGATVTEIPVNHRPRLRGTSKYGISRTVRVVLDLLTIKFLSGYSTRPIHVFGFLGLIATILGLAITGMLGVEKLLFGVTLADRPLLLLGILLVLGGVQFVTLGLLGEMLARTYHESARQIPPARPPSTADEESYLTVRHAAGTFVALGTARRAR